MTEQVIKGNLGNSVSFKENTWPILKTDTSLNSYYLEIGIISTPVGLRIAVNSLQCQLVAMQKQKKVKMSISKTSSDVVFPSVCYDYVLLHWLIKKRL